MRAEVSVRKRLAVLLTALTVLFSLIGVRIGDLTLVEGAALTARGVRQWTREGVVTARRGRVEDRRGDTLALSADAYIVSADPRQVADETAFARLLSPLLGADEAGIVKKLQNKNAASVMLKRQVPRETVDAIRALKAQSPEAERLLNGVTFDEDTRRYYPKGVFLCQALGFTNVDSVGQSGLEGWYEALLRGENGSLRTETDARARLLPDGKTAYTPPKSGSTLRLTVDGTIQGVVEKAMRECLADNNAKSVRCVVMDVDTGEILALCMKPDYDPNDPPRGDVELLNSLMRITAVSDVYEPGSTFKMLTCAAALDSGTARLTDMFHCGGSISVDGDRIRCWKNSHGTQTLKEALANSCNPAFVTLALRMGTDTFYRYLRAFGLGVRTGVDLPGESAGILMNSRYVKNVDLARIGFGQSVAVTPLQLITAACSVVNGGRLMRPYILKEVRDEAGNVIDRTLPQVVANPIREETSAIMRELLENVVENGGGKNAAIAGYRIGGKTGTAQVYRDGRVVSDVHIGSFLGFAPMDDPKVAVLVTVEEAHVPVDFGSQTAAPYARQIMEEILPYLGVRRQAEKDAPEMTVPDCTGMTVALARQTLSAISLFADTDGQSDTVAAQTPSAGAKMPAGGTVMLYTYVGEPVKPMDMICVPDVTGLPIVEASRVLRSRGLLLQIEGSGLSVGQSPAAGVYAAVGDTVQVIFELPWKDAKNDAAI